MKRLIILIVLLTGALCNVSAQDRLLARENLQKGESLSDIIAPNALEWIMKYKETKDESQNSQT